MLQGVNLDPPPANLVLITDASQIGWGAHLGEMRVSGTWDIVTSKKHINWLEMKVVFLTLIHFQSLVVSERVLLRSDNTTVVAYVNKQGDTVSRAMSTHVGDASVVS